MESGMVRKTCLVQGVCAGLLSLVLFPAMVASGDEQTIAASAPAQDLGNLSLEDLMNIEITSVSKQKQKVSQAPAAVTVISQEDIRRSGMTSIPELLRLAPGLDVARVDANK